MNDKEKLSCLTDRPCTACKFHKEKGCSKWSCVFEEKTDVPEREKGELTEEEVIEWCNKRGYVVVTGEACKKAIHAFDPVMRGKDNE